MVFRFEKEGVPATDRRGFADAFHLGVKAVLFPGPQFPDPTEPRFWVHENGLVEIMSLTDDPTTRASLAILKRYRGEQGQVYVARFLALLDALGDERAEKWKQRSDRGTPEIDTALVYAAAFTTVPPGSDLAFDLDEFFANVEMVAAEP